MADLPVVPQAPEVEPTEEAQGGNPGAISRFGDGMESGHGSDAAYGFLKLPWLRQAGLMVGFAGVIAFGVLLVFWSQDPEYRPLYGNLETVEISGIVKVLEMEGISFTVEPQSGIILVPMTELHEARMVVAAADILVAKSDGYLLLDEEQELGTSQFMEGVRYQRAIEGELAKTISSLKNVNKARVKLGIPKQSVFVRDNRKPKASVFLEVVGGKTLGNKEVRAIMSLVASGVPEMSRENVSVVDQSGNLLSEMESDSGIGETEKQFEFAQKVEQEMIQKVQNILRPIMGETRFDAQVAAEVDFTWVEETQEMFNPDLPAIRSEKKSEDIRSGVGEGGIPGALSNQPPGPVLIPENAANVEEGENAATLRQRRESTRNYELDRNISYTRHSVGQVARLTIAVVIDDQLLLNAETGEFESVPWDEASLARLSQLIQSAVGFNQSRGDQVTVINEAFIPVEEIAIPEPGFWTEAWFLVLIKQLMVGLLVVFLTFFVLRPVLAMLAGPSAEDRMKELIAEQELERLAERELEAEEELMQETVTLSGGEELLLPGPGDMFARQLEAIRALVDENPSRVAQVVKEWVGQEA
ncbi:MAG: flagellar M-ring protein FliF [Pseudomonadales bacterium]|nr:flagellar M-ring protein FliF [Pseudomonadales bacterium]